VWFFVVVVVGGVEMRGDGGLPTHSAFTKTCICISVKLEVFYSSLANRGMPPAQLKTINEGLWRVLIFIYLFTVR
jgi:hypothetical protein